MVELLSEAQLALHCAEVRVTKFVKFSMFTKCNWSVFVLRSQLHNLLLLLILEVSHDKVRTFWEAQKNLRNLSHGLHIYLANVQTMRKIFSHFVCFSKSPNFSSCKSTTANFKNIEGGCQKYCFLQICKPRISTILGTPTLLDPKFVLFYTYIISILFYFVFYR